MQTHRLLPIALALAVALSCSTLASGETPRSLFRRPIDRDGVHFKIAFGWGGSGGGDSGGNGAAHDVELGGTVHLREGRLPLTIAYQHLFVATDAFFGDSRPSGLFGGHFLTLKTPLVLSELEVKLGLGLGESVSLKDGFTPYFGFGWSAGMDLDVPLTSTSGLVLGWSLVQAVTERFGSQFGLFGTLGYVWF